MIINDYELTSELTNANSGFSKGGFAVKNGREYFIKELISPVYPIDEGVLSEKLIERRRGFCLDFEERSKRLYQKINSASRGNLVRIEEFFRCDSRYYLVTEKISNAKSFMSVCSMPEKQKHLVLKSMAFAFYCLHKSGVVHCDVKPSNILVNSIDGINYTAKLIDFDAAGIENEMQKDIEPGGDLTYLSPETFLQMIGEGDGITAKSDIFSLGLVYYQFFAGELPPFNKNKYDYPYEAVLDGCRLPPSPKIPVPLRKIILRMIDVNPMRRPTAFELYRALSPPVETTFGLNPEETEYIETRYNVEDSADKNKSEFAASGGLIRPGGDL